MYIHIIYFSSYVGVRVTDVIVIELHVCAKKSDRNVTSSQEQLKLKDCMNFKSFISLLNIQIQIKKLNSKDVHDNSMQRCE